MVEEVLDNGAGDGREEEFCGEGEVVEFGDFGGLHHSEIKGLAGEFAEVLAGGPGDFARDLIDGVRDFVHRIIITYRGGRWYNEKNER